MQLQVNLTWLHCTQAIYGLRLVVAAAAEGGDFAAEVVFMSLAVLLVTQTLSVRRLSGGRTGKRIERGGGGGDCGNGVIWSSD